MSAQQTQEPLETVGGEIVAGKTAPTVPARRFPPFSRSQIAPAAVLLVVVALAVAIARVFVKAERTVYYWDYSGYWQPSAGVKSLLLSDATNAIRTIVSSVRNDEYNLLHAVPTGIWMIVFGESRGSYEIAIVVLYAVPAAAVLSWLLSLITGGLWSERVSSTWRFVILFTLVLLNPIVLLPVLRGYPDILGLIFVGLAFIVYAKSRSNPTVRRLLLIAVLLLTATLFRRWYIFGAASMMTAIGVDQLIMLIRARAAARVYLVRAGIIAVMGAAFCGLFAAIAFPYVSHLLTTDYTDIYKAYKLDSNYVDLALRSIRHFGFVYLLISAAGVVLALRSRRTLRGVIGVSCLAALIAFLLVGRVQIFDVHQYYLLTVPILIGIACVTAALTRLTRTAALAVATTFGVIVVGYAALALPVYFQIPGIYDPVRNAMGPTAQGQPFVRTDTEALKALYTDVYELQSGDNSVYVLSTSSALNIDLLRNIPISLDPSMPRIPNSTFTLTTLLDSRDGFVTSVFDAPFVVDASPPGFITGVESEQASMTVLHDAMQPGGILAEYYDVVDSVDLVDTYDPDEIVAVTIKQRVAEVPQDVRDQIVAQIREINPNIALVP